MSESTSLLTIQKFVFLLDDFHYQQFETYLTETKADLPLKLSQSIRRKMPAFDSHESLCTKVYGNYTKGRLAFNQLASHTFKLTGNLAVNHPMYLSPNYTRLERLINRGETKQAEFLARTLLDISEKIEDYLTQIFVLKFLIQHSFLTKQSSEGIKLSARLEKVYETERICNNILSIVRMQLNLALVPLVTPKRLNDIKKRLHSYHNHPLAAMRVLSKYAYIYAIFYHDHAKFKDKAVGTVINSLEKDLENYPYITLPFLLDLHGLFSFYKLNHTHNFGRAAAKPEVEELAKGTSVKFWNSYLNIPGILVIALKISGYLQVYQTSLHRPEYSKILTADDLSDINAMAANCRQMLAHRDLDRYYKYDIINLKFFHAGLLILSGGAGIKKGAAELEEMLVTYQQVKLAGTTDSIFLLLMLAYFAMGNYQGCASAFKRYTRSSKGKTVIEDNDTDIKLYFYLSQWLQLKTARPLVKLQQICNDVIKNNPHPAQVAAVRELVTYFKVPLT